MFDAFFDALLKFILEPIVEFILEAILKPIYKYILFPIFEPVCWLMGSIGVLILTFGLIHPSRRKKSKLTGMWGYRKGEQYYFDRDLVSGIGLILWFIFLSIFSLLKFS